MLSIMTKVMVTPKLIKTIINDDDVDRTTALPTLVVAETTTTMATEWAVTSSMTSPSAAAAAAAETSVSMTTVGVTSSGHVIADHLSSSSSLNVSREFFRR